MRSCNMMIWTLLNFMSLELILWPRDLFVLRDKILARAR